MYKLVVLTDTESAFGFRLGGVEVVEAEDSDDARAKLNGLLNDDSSGIVAVREEFMEDLDERLQRKISQIDRPIVISIPLKSDLEAPGERREYLAQLIKRAVGFDIKL
ncbi:MAG: V-type ATP synthase subunit F [Terriglobia bacterium]